MITILTLVALQVTTRKGSDPAFIESVDLGFTKEGGYQLRIKARGAQRPFISTLYTPRRPTISVIGDPGIGPVVLVQLFNGQVDILNAICYRDGRWVSNRLIARWGILVTRGRLGQVYIESRITNDERFHSPNAPTWISEWHTIKQGQLAGPMNRKPHLVSPDDF